MAEISGEGNTRKLLLNVINGNINIAKVTLEGYGSMNSKTFRTLKAGESQEFLIKPAK
jgi:hypothetical protein